LNKDLVKEEQLKNVNNVNDLQYTKGIIPLDPGDLIVAYLKNGYASPAQHRSPVRIERFYDDGQLRGIYDQ
jgi:hypothetical protein